MARGKEFNVDRDGLPVFAETILIAQHHGVVNILGPLIGIAFATVVFGEIPHHSPLHIALGLFGLAGIAYGLHGLAKAETSAEVEIKRFDEMAQIL